MANPYYTPSGIPATQTRGVSANQRAEFISIETGFDDVYAEILTLAAAIGIPTSVTEVPVASSATTDIGNGYGPVILITGNNAITSLGANYKAGIFARFQGVLTLTHSSSLLCPGAENIITEAGDACIFVPIGNPASGWRVAAYCRMSRGLVDDYAVRTSSTYANPSWLTSIAWSKVTGTPTTISGYGINDAPTKTGTGASGSWGIDITGNAATATTAISANNGVPVGTIIPCASNRAKTGYLKCNAASYASGTYPELFADLVKYATATMTIASPGVVTWTNHGLSANDPVKFTTTGALPTGVTAGTTYYVLSASITTNTFQISATPGGAAINTSGSQSGTHTAINAPYGCADNLGTFNVPESRGEFLRGWDDGRGIDANRVFGSAQAQDVQPHLHGISFPTSGYLNSGPTYGASAGGGITTSGPSTFPTSTNNSSGTETRPRNIAPMFQIKY